MNLNIIAQLVQILRDAPELGAIEVRRGLFGSWSAVRLTKTGQQTNAGGQHVIVAQPPASGSPAPAAAPEPAGGAGGSGGRRDAAPPTQLLEIKSPMVGTFYSAPEPGAAPYIKTGSRVAPRQVVCIIEAMKIMNEIESEVAGVIREVLVENSQPVEFGQTLFRVDPHA